jgi:hypothetical protein
VFEPTSEAVPVIAPVDELIERPVGKAPDVIEYVIVSPSGSTAAAEEIVYEERALSDIVPNVPDAVLKTGLASTDKQVSKVANNPERFVTRMLYGSCAPKKELCGIKAVS